MSQQPVPKGWQLRLLTDFCRPKQWPTIQSSSLLSEGYPVYGANGLIGYYSNYTHESKTIAITCRGASCGTINMAPEQSYITGNAMALDEVDITKVDLDFIYYALHKSNINEIISGSAQPQITGNNLKHVKLLCPPLNEQKKISEILGGVDQTIKTTRQVIDQTRQVKRTLMQELLTRGLPGKHTRFRQTPLGEIPEDWGEPVKLGITILVGPQNGLYKHDSEYGSGTYIVRIDDFNNGVFKRSHFKRVSLTEKEIALYKLAPDDILINRVNSISHLGKAAIVPTLEEDVVFESNMMRIKFDPQKLLPEFAILWLCSSVAKNQINRKAKRAVAQCSISQTDVKDFLIALPKVEEQREIVKLLTATENHITHTEDTLLQLQTTKCSLMQALLSGDKRVNIGQQDELLEVAV